LSIPNNSTFLWCNEDIKEHNTEIVKYEATEVVEILSASAPTITTNLEDRIYYNKD